MALTEGQVQIVRDNGTALTMGENTQFIVSGFDPWSRQVRASQTGDAPWSDGGWSGAEWREVASISFGVFIDAASNTEWQALHWQLDAIFAPVRTGGDIELHWVNAGFEYLMYGRPRMLQSRVRNLRSGKEQTQAAVSCPDPAIYSAAEHVTTIGLLHRIGGLSVPFGLPTGIHSVIAGGEATISNAGTGAARLLLRITGPVANPRITLIDAAGPQTLYLTSTLGADDYIDIDTKDKVVVLNGSTSRLADQYGAWPLLTGTASIRFEADVYEPDASLTITTRDTW